MDQTRKIYRSKNRRDEFKLIDETVVDIEELVSIYLNLHNQSNEVRTQFEQSRKALDNYEENIGKIFYVLKKLSNIDRKKLHKSNPKLFADLVMLHTELQLEDEDIQLDGSKD